MNRQNIVLRQTRGHFAGLTYDGPSQIIGPKDE